MHAAVYVFTNPEQKQCRYCNHQTTTTQKYLEQFKQNISQRVTYIYIVYLQ